MLSSRALLMIEIWNSDMRRCLARQQVIRNSGFIERKVVMIYR